MRDASGRFLPGHHVSTEWKKGVHVSPDTEFKKGEHSSASTEFKKGEPSAWKGHKASAETRAKQSAAKKGKISQSQIDNLVKHAKRGAEHHNWKGGITDEDKLLRSKFRQSMQPAVFKRDNYTCQICEQYGGSLQVDHIKPWALFPELRFDINNCRTLCMSCHYYITFKRKIPKGISWGHNFSRRITS